MAYVRKDKGEFATGQIVLAHGRSDRYMTPTNQMRLLLRMMAALIPGVKNIMPQDRVARNSIKSKEIVAILEKVLRNEKLPEDNLPPFPKVNNLKGSYTMYVDWYSYFADLLNWELVRQGKETAFNAVGVASLFTRRMHSNKGYEVDADELAKYGIDLSNWPF